MHKSYDGPTGRAMWEKRKQSIIRSLNGERVNKEPKRLYLLQCSMTGLVKIGIAVDVAQRMNTIQTMCPTRLEVLANAPGGRELERALHEKYADKRQHGEWFDLTHDDLQKIIRSLPEDKLEPERSDLRDVAEQYAAKPAASSHPIEITLSDAQRRFHARLEEALGPALERKR